MRWLPMALLFVVAALLVFGKLGDRLLWQDEAQTALISETVLTHGVPLGTDGTNFFSQEQGVEYGPHYLWRWQTWLPFYVTAGSFAVLGKTTLAARLPWALFGFASILLLYRYALAAWRDRRVALAAAGLLTLCVPFLLLSRQCRYYAGTAFFSLLGLYFYERLRAGKRFPLVGIIASGVLLFHIHFLYCATYLLTLLVHTAWRERRLFWRIFIACAVVTVLSSPWVIWLAGMKYGERYGGHWFHLMPTLISLGGYLEPLVLRTLPPLFLGGLLLAVVTRRLRGRVEWGPPGAFLVPLLYLGITVAVLAPTSPFPWYRYLAPLLPILCLVLARPLVVAFEIHPLIGGVLVAALAFMGPLPDYLYELTHDYRGPVEGLVRFFQKNAVPGQTAAVTYEDMPVAFYTGLRVIGAFGGADLTPAYTADWIVIRRNAAGAPDKAMAEALQKNVKWSDYQRVEIDAPDTLFDNREAIMDPVVDDRGGHPFRTDEHAPRLAVFRRVAWQPTIHRESDGVHIQVAMADPGLATVYVAKGSRVYVLHASAALGTGIYEKDGDAWKKVQDFTWQCRDKDDRDCRAKFMASDGWWGETYPQGSSKREIIIGEELARDARVVVVAYRYPGEIHPSPAETDETVNEELLKGTLPETAAFNTASWPALSD